MSEPNQLYACVRLSRARLDELLASPFPDPSGDDEVLAWLEKGSYYGPRYTPDSIRKNVLAEVTTVGAWIDELMEPAPYGFAMPARNGYDEATQAWTLAALDFSENYDDYLAAIAVFREAAKYKDLPGTDGFLIYGYLFDNSQVTVALQIEMGASKFVDEDEARKLVSEACVTMEALVAEGGAAAGDDEL